LVGRFFYGLEIFIRGHKMGQMRLEILNFLTLKSDFADEANPRNFKHENSIRVTAK